MGGYRLVHLPKQLVITAKWCDVEESHPILLSEPDCARHSNLCVTPAPRPVRS